jgi:hypothetical protein
MNEDEWCFLNYKQKLIVLDLIKKYELQRDALVRRGASLKDLKLGGYNPDGSMFCTVSTEGVTLERIGK